MTKYTFKNLPNNVKYAEIELPQFSGCQNGKIYVILKSSGLRIQPAAFIQLNNRYRFSIVILPHKGEIHFEIFDVYKDSVLCKQVIINNNSYNHEQENEIIIFYKNWIPTSITLNNKKLNNSESHIIELFDIVKFYSKAWENGDLIGAVACLHFLIENQLIFLLTKTTVGNNGNPLSEEEITDKKYGGTISFARLNNLALEKNFIQSDLYEELKEFNNDRNIIIHRILKHSITNTDIETILNKSSPLQGKLQNLYMQFKSAKLVTFPLAD